jgi:hypothetical protein
VKSVRPTASTRTRPVALVLTVASSRSASFTGSTAPTVDSAAPPLTISERGRRGPAGNCQSPSVHHDALTRPLEREEDTVRTPYVVGVIAVTDREADGHVPEEAAPELLARLRHQSQRATLIFLLATVGGILLIIAIASRLPPSGP